MEVKSCAQENLGKLLINIQSIWAVHALGDTSIVKIGKVRLSDKIKKMNFIMPKFSLVGPLIYGLAYSIA